MLLATSVTSVGKISNTSSNVTRVSVRSSGRGMRFFFFAAIVQPPQSNMGRFRPCPIPVALTKKRTFLPSVD
jgi:hypothetical protein